MEEKDNDGEDTLSPIQRQLLSEASISTACFKPKASVCDGKRDADLRRAVFDAVVQLSEVISENVLRVQLPFLHCSSWDEAVEERFLGSPRLCGFPTCGEVIEVQLKKQKYFIDREARKIYEHRIESDMYCSRPCMLRSAFIRAQLSDEPLWLSGDISRRMCMSFKLNKPSEEYEVTTGRREIEVVRAVEEKLSDLRIREAESSTESEVEDDQDDERDVKSYIETVTSLIGEEEGSGGKEKGSGTPSPKSATDTSVKPKAVSESTTNKSAKLCGNQITPSSRRSIEISTPALNPKLPDPQMAAKLSLSKAELEKLSRLRSKYLNRGAKKPIIIDPTPAPFLSTSEKLSPQGTASSSSTKATSSAPEEVVRTVRSLFRGWITDRTRQLLQSGGLCISDSTDSLMKQFYRPFGEYSGVERNEVILPSVDSIDVQKKRLHIFLDTVKKPLAGYQRELEFTFSRFNWLYVTAATFSLNPTTITNFSNEVLKLICLVLLKLRIVRVNFRLMDSSLTFQLLVIASMLDIGSRTRRLFDISKLDNAVEDAVFPAEQPSEKLMCCLSTLGIAPSDFNRLTSEILDDSGTG